MALALFGGGGQNKDDRSSLDNAAKTLLANIRFLDVDNPVRTMVITSAVPNEGKTFVAANLANAIATSGKTVLLVECDMRRRSMANFLGAHGRHGLYSVLSGESQLKDAVVTTSVPDLFFLDAEPHIPNPSDLLSSARFTRLVGFAAETYDYVVFDLPPVGTFVDAAVLGAKVDAVFMVVREGFTKKAEIAAAAEQLRKSGCNLAGVVMNYCERRDSEYYYEYYYTREGHHDEGAPKFLGSDDAQERGGETPPPAKPARKGLPTRPARRTVMSAVKDSLETREAEAEVPAALKEPPATPWTDLLDDEEDDPIMDTDMFTALAQRGRQARTSGGYSPSARVQGSPAHVSTYIPSHGDDEY